MSRGGPLGQYRGLRGGQDASSPRRWHRADPIFTVTHAITIAARPDDVWPWLAQMGAHRSGWYRRDRIDDGGRPSADDMLAQYQHVEPGEALPALPGAAGVFVVASVAPESHPCRPK